MFRSSLCKIYKHTIAHPHTHTHTHKHTHTSCLFSKQMTSPGFLDACSNIWAVVAQDSGRSHSPAHSIMFYTVTWQGWEFPRVLWVFFFLFFFGGGWEMAAEWLSFACSALVARPCSGVLPWPFIILPVICIMYDASFADLAVTLSFHPCVKSAHWPALCFHE